MFGGEQARTADLQAWDGATTAGRCGGDELLGRSEAAKRCRNDEQPNQTHRVPPGVFAIVRGGVFAPRCCAYFVSPPIPMTRRGALAEVYASTQTVVYRLLSFV